VLIVVHVALAIALFLPPLLLPFALRVRSRSAQPALGTGRVARGLVALQARSAAPLGIAVAASGLAIVATVGWGVLSQPWLLAALAIYAADLVLAFFIQRPGLLAIVRGGGARAAIAGARGSSDGEWAARARRQRYVSYLMAGLIGTIGVLMTTKPTLW
jgi:hypothetical protein